MSVIEIDGLVKKYGDNIAVDHLDLNIEKGKVYGFLGPNGAGKSTTMNIITGYIGASDGVVKICGRDIFKEAEKAKKCVGYLPEMPPLYQDMTVREYLQFVAELKQISKGDRKKNIEEALEKTKTTQVENRLIKNLSKGYKQRVGIAQALLGMPEVIILDEPTVGLDPKQIIEIRKLIRELGKKHTVILSSHILTEISEACDYIYIISRGKLVAEGSESQLVEQMAGQNILNITVKTNVEKAKDIFCKIRNVSDIVFVEKEEQVDVSLISERDVDLRENVFYLCADQKIPILKMDFVQKTLEDVFIELTKEYQAPEKKKHRLSRKEKVEKEIEEDELIGQEDVDEIVTNEDKCEEKEGIENKVQEEDESC